VGLAFLTRPDVLPFVVATVAVLCIILGVRRGLTRSIIFVIPLIAMMLLLGYRNKITSGDFYILSPQGAVNLYAGNSLASDGKTPQAPATRTPYQITADPSDDAMLVASRLAAREEVGRELSDRDLGRYYINRTLRDIRADPLRWIRLVLGKVYYFFNSYEHSDIKPLWRLAGRHSRILELPLISYVVVMPLGVLGMALVLTRRMRLGYVAVGGFVAFAFNCIAFFVSWRNRLPAVVFLWILAGYGLTAIVADVRRRRYLRVGIACVVVAALALIASSSFLDATDEPFATQYLINEAAVYAMDERYDDAIAIYEEAIANDPINPGPYYLLGKLYATLGRVDEAEQMMASATKLDPGYLPYAHLTLGVALTRAGKVEAAIEHFRQALAADPNLGLASYNLGLCLLNAGKVDEARQALVRAQNLCQDDMRVMTGIAAAWVKLGEPERAQDIMEALVRSYPADADVLYTMGLVLEAEGRIDEALAYFRRALRYRPDLSTIRSRIEKLESQKLAK